jgi:hypothetical protein
MNKHLVLMTAVLALFMGPGAACLAQTATTGTCYVRWPARVTDLGKGSEAGISLINSYLFIVLNGNTSDLDGKIYERLGTLGQGYQTPIVSLGNSTYYANGYHPSVSMNSDGLVVEVHDNHPAWLAGSELFYKIGTVNPSGGENQEVNWSGYWIRFDAGRFPQVAINDSRMLVEVHESQDLTSNKLYYRTGHILGEYPRFIVIWDSGDRGIEYNSGRRPHITLDNAGNVVEVHQESKDKNLHYRRGHLNNSGTRIDWSAAPSNGRYVTGNGTDPAVSLANNGFVLETDTNFSNVAYDGGNVNFGTSNVIDWDTRYILDNNGGSSSVSTNGQVAAAVYRRSNDDLEIKSGYVTCP